MRRCPKCGKEYDNTWALCLSCGDKLIICDSVVEEKAGNKTDKEELKAYFKKAFDGFDSGRSAASWNWFAALFQLTWYMFKGLWPKVFLYGGIFWALNSSLSWLGLYSFIPFLWVLSIVYFGLFANHDYYLYKEKQEPFWPGMPYKKLKIPFWAVIVALVLYNTVYLGYGMTKAVTAFTQTAKPGAMVSFVSEGIEFSNIPGQWVVFKDPPTNFWLSISRPVNRNASESMSYTAFPGTKFMGYVGEEPDKEKVYKGLIAFVEDKPKFNMKFGSLRDAAVINKAKLLAGAEKIPFYIKWMQLIKSKPEEIEYVEFSGQGWGLIKNNLELNFFGNKTTFYIATYWTVANGKAIFLTSESFEPFKDEVKAQVESFLSSFKVS